MEKRRFINPSLIRKIRNESDQRAYEWTFPAKHINTTGKNLDDYKRVLPKFGGRNFVEHIEAKIASGSSNVRVLDLGCGQGVCSAMLMRDFPQVKSSGMSARDFRPLLPENLSELIKRVDYRIGGAHRLNEVFAENDFDFITALYVFEYFADPLAVLKKAYRMLKPEGIMFINNLHIPLKLKEKPLLEELWKKQGINVYIDWPYPEHIAERDSVNISIMRDNSPRLPLPFKYNPRVNYVESFGHKIPRLSYRLTLP